MNTAERLKALEGENLTLTIRKNVLEERNGYLKTKAQRLDEQVHYERKKAAEYELASTNLDLSENLNLIEQIEADLTRNKAESKALQQLLSTLANEAGRQLLT